MYFLLSSVGRLITDSRTGALIRLSKSSRLCVAGCFHLSQYPPPPETFVLFSCQIPVLIWAFETAKNGRKLRLSVSQSCITNVLHSSSKPWQLIKCCILYFPKYKFKTCSCCSRERKHRCKLCLLAREESVGNDADIPDKMVSPVWETSAPARRMLHLHAHKYPLLI